MDPLAVHQVKLRELLRLMESRLESDPSTNRKASIELKAKLVRMRARLTCSQSGYSREAAKKVLAALMREAAEIAIRLMVEAFIRLSRNLSSCRLEFSGAPFVVSELRAA